jgi:cytochrome c-type biogenesis protein CcmE
MKTRLAPRLRYAIAGLVILAALGGLAVSGLGASIRYYRTPSEVSAGKLPHGRFRLGGEVLPGSVSRVGDDQVRFVVTDGAAEVPVLHRGNPPGVFQEGQGALVEGVFEADGVFHSDFLIVKHSNEYKGPGTKYEKPGDAGTSPSAAGKGTP